MPLEQALVDMAMADNFAVISSLMPDGQPQTHLMWVDADDEHVLMNTEVHRQKFANVQRDPRVTVTIWERGRPYRYVEVRGEVVDTVRGQAARDHIDALSRKYRGEDYDDARITSERVILRIAPHRVRHWGS